MISLMNSSALLAALTSCMGFPFGDGCVDLHRKPTGNPAHFPLKA